MAEDRDAFETALEEAIALFEQGEGLDGARFDALMAEIRARLPDLEATPADDPRAEKIRQLQARANQLEARAAAQHGDVMEDVNEMLTPLMGRGLNRPV